MTSGEEVERLLTGDPPFPRKAWRRMRGWYRVLADYSPATAQITLEWITEEREELYRAVPPPPGGEYSHICAAPPNGQLRTYIG